MMNRRKNLVTTVLAASTIMASLAIPISSVAQGAPLAPRETAVAPETNPPGDIPDNQVFIDYTAPAGFSMQVPEGWSRSDTATGVSFADKYGTIDIATAKADKAPTPQSIQQREVPDLVAGGHAVEVTDVRAMTLPAGDAVALDYLSNSAINPVTNRQIRLENRRIYLFHAGQEAIVTFSAPAGADNVDAWKMMAESLRWPS
mgnify:FL=1